MKSILYCKFYNDRNTAKNNSSLRKTTAPEKPMSDLTEVKTATNSRSPFDESLNMRELCKCEIGNTSHDL